MSVRKEGKGRKEREKTENVRKRLVCESEN
jgi:hypothetical protein